MTIFYCFNQNQIHYNKRRSMRLYLLTYFLFYCFYYSGLASSPLVNPTNPNFQSGLSTLISSGSQDTTAQTYPILLGNAMSSASLKTVLSILGQQMTLSGQSMGYQLTIQSVSTSHLYILVRANANANPLTYLRICYMVTSYVQLHVNYRDYAFKPLTDRVVNFSLIGSIPCPISALGPIQCRKTAITLPYATMATSTKKAVGFISGFAVNNFQTGASVVFGLGLKSQSAGASALSLDVHVYGRALLVSVSIFYISYESSTLNAYGDKIILQQQMTVGCSFSWDTSNTSIVICGVNQPSNITFETENTGFNTFYQANYFFGYTEYIGGYDTTSSYSMGFDVTGTALAGTTYRSIFTYTGNGDGIFMVKYNYIIILQFYCPSVGSDIYYAYGQNSCNSTCAAGIKQYPDANRKCKPCGIYCYRCSGNYDLCDDCYVSHNRILSGDDCNCLTIGYYDDGSSLICPSCHYSCRSCTGPSASQCIDCWTTGHRTIDINSCFCDLKFYDAAGPVCVACHYSCLTCTGASNNNCLTCKATDFREVNSVLNRCPCMIEYYNNNTDKCVLCHYSCWTCSGPGTTNCLTCNTTVEFRIKDASNSCPCSLGYYDSGSQVCSICHVTCSGCDGPGRNDCTSCDNAKYRAIMPGECKCIANYYEINVTCYQCHYTCFNCTGGAMNECLNCNPLTTFRNYNGALKQCYCIQGYTDVGVTQCKKCDRTCLTCENVSTLCITCDPLKNRQLVGTTCPCLMGYVDISSLSGMCFKCHYSCVTCTGTASTQCSSCNLIYRTLSGGQCLCNTHTYDNGIFQQCLLCHAECQECTDQYQTTCKSCNPAYLRQIVGVAPQPCTCIQRHFQNSNALLCDSCHFSCLTCSVIATNCTTCDSAINHRYIATGAKCLCQAHYYEVNAQSCLSCISTCGNCSTQPNNCTSCLTGRYLVVNSCMCNLGTYQDLFLACLPCHYYCKTCQNTTTTCLSCPIFSFRTLNSANCPCNFGYYDNSTVTCVKCPYQCDECTGPDPAKCIACPLSSQRTLQLNQSCTCDIGFYDDGSSPACKACKNTCQSCSFFSVCTSCYPLANQFRSLVINDCKCIVGYYSHLTNPICLLCHYSCVSCNGGLSTNCITCQTNRIFTSVTSNCPCKPGFYQSLQICYACDLSCKTCSLILTNCTSCDTLSRNLFNNQCLCRQGFFENGGTCSPCNIKCRTCTTSSTNCLTCNVFHLTILSGNTCVCLPNQYQSLVTLMCSTCSFKCQTCSSAGQTACLTCIPGKFRTYNAVNKTCDCDAGFYENGDVSCVVCDTKCLTCYGPTQRNCSSCHPGANKLGSSCRTPITCSSGFYYQGYCLAMCPNSTYPSPNICNTCINNCKTCMTAIKCTSCIYGYYYNSTQNTCNINCLPERFINRITRECEACPLGCQICYQRNQTINCPKCLAGYYLFNQTSCVDAAFCVFPRYVISGFKCYLCEYPCQTCNSLNFDGCITCASNYSLYAGQCLSVCPLGYYSSDKVCRQCQLRCKQCSQTACSLCKDGYYLTLQLENPRCITNKLFFNPGTNIQQECHPNCYSCTNSSFSSCITCQKFRGDDSEMAISGYCQCWQDSIDIGAGNCSFNQFQQFQTYTKVLKSMTDSALYISGVSSVFSANFLSAGTFLLYQQSYSMLYFINSSAVLQTDQYLKQALNKNFNFYLSSKRAENSTRPLYSARRLLVTLQGDQSLFTRGKNYSLYLFDWAFYTVIITLSLWALALFSHCLLKSKRVSQNDIMRTIFSNIKNIIQQSAVIILHLLTVSQISLYATVTLKFMYQNSANLQIDWYKLVMSIIVIVYYVGYILRLAIGSYIVGRCQDSGRKTIYNPLKLLVFYFEHEQIRQLKGSKKSGVVMVEKSPNFAQIPTLKKLYIPLLMIRLCLSSILIIHFSSSPMLQVGSALGIIIVWTVYSLFCCPYPKFCRIFIHLNQFIYIAQISTVLFSVMSSQNSRIIPAQIQMVLNGMQIISMALFSILFIVKLIYGICQGNKKATSNKIQNIYFTQNENNQSQLCLNQNKRDQQALEITENVFDKDLQIQDQLENQQAINKNSQENIDNQRSNQGENKLRKNAHKNNSSDHKNQTNIIYIDDENIQEQNVIIRKKYRAVRKNVK